MITVCEECGDVGYGYLLVSCNDCKGAAVHLYCLEKIVLDGSLVDWFCYECQLRHIDVTHERPSQASQPITANVESTIEAGQGRNRENKSYKSTNTSVERISSRRMNSMARKQTRKKSNIKPKGNKANRRDHNTSTMNNACTTGEEFHHSCEAITMETAKVGNSENHQVDSEHSVHTLNNDHVANCLTPMVKQTNVQKPLDHSEFRSNVAEKFNLPKGEGGSFCSSPDVEMPAPLVEDCLSNTLGSPNQSCSLKAMNGLICKSKNAAQSNTKPTKRLFMPKNFKVLKSPKDGVGSRSKNAESSNPRNEQANSLLEKENGDKNTVDRAMPSSANMDVLAKENNYLPSEHIGINNQKSRGVTPVLTGENQSGPSRLVDQTYSNSFKETSSKANIVLETSATAVEFSDTTQNFVKDNPRKRGRFILPDNDDDKEEAADVQTGDFVNDNPRKRRRLILPDDDDDNEEVADVPTEDFVKNNTRKRRQLILSDSDDDKEEAADAPTKDSNPQSLGYDGSMNKNRVDTENYVEAVQSRNLKGQDLKNGRLVKKQEFVQDGEQAVQLDNLIPHSSKINWPVKRRRRYIEAHEDEEDEEVIASIENSKCALNDVAQLASQTVVAKDQLLQSRIAFDLESANQQCYIYSQPIDEPVWSGTFKVNNKVSVKLAAHQSTKACQRVWELSSSLKPVVEVMKLHRSEAWPESWKTSGPTDENIGLFFFSHCMRSNEEFDRLVEEIIDIDAVLKIVVDGAELLIFPSTLLPEQNHVFRGKHYLWGVFKRREDRPDKVVLGKERDGSACAAEEQEMQEHPCLEQQYEVQCESSDQETSVVKHVVHVENQLLAERNCEAQTEAIKTGTREGLASSGSSSSSIKPNSPKAGSNNFLQPRIGRKLHAAEEVDQQEDEQARTSSPRCNSLYINKQSSDSRPAAVTPKSINSAERDHGQQGYGPAPSSTTLFGFVTARTKRSQQLIQEMVSEGALLFPVLEEMMITGSTLGNSTVVELDATPGDKNPHKQERSQFIDFVSTGHGDSDGASDACLELFPVRNEHIGWTPRVEVGGEVDLDLGLRARSRAPAASL